MAQRPRPKPTAIRTALLVEDHGRGEWLAHPLAAPSLAAWGGPGDDPTDIFALALPLHLATLPAPSLAAFLTPPETTVRTVAVPLVRADLPRTIAASPPLGFAYTVGPYGPKHRDLWVEVPRLGLALRVEPDTPLDELDRRVAREVVRVFFAAPPDDDTLRELLPPVSTSLRWLEVTLDAPDSQTLEPHGDTVTSATLAVARREARRLLASISSPLHLAHEGKTQKFPDLFGRDDALATLDRLTRRGSVLVTGPELAGKTALVHALAKTRELYATSGARLMAGMSLLGQWQERLRRVLQAAKRADALLYIENLAELLSESSQTSDELAAALRPALEDGSVRLVCELRDRDVDRLERRFPAFFRTLTRLALEPLSPADTARALGTSPTLRAEAATEIVALAGRFLPHLALPGAACLIRDEISALAAQTTPIDRDRVLALYAAAHRLPAWLLRDDLPFDPDTIRAALDARVIGQPDAVAALSDVIAAIKSRLSAPDKPLASLLFVGPTGVGKTELARALAHLLFGHGDAMARFDMSEFMDATAAERLIRGVGRGDGLLTRHLRQNPFGVILLDEIEKAHSSVFDLLLQALGDGHLTDATGRVASLKSAIVILTSNIGATERKTPLGLTPDTTEPSLARHYLDAVKKSFRPELVNRLDRIIPFRTLDFQDIRRIADLLIEKIRRRPGLADITLSLSDAALNHLCELGHHPRYGGRGLRRALETHLTARLANALAPLSRTSSDAPLQIHVDREDAIGLTVSVTRGHRPARHTPRTRTYKLRLAAQGFLRTVAADEVRARLELIELERFELQRAQHRGLATPGDGRRLGALLEEETRLTELLTPFVEAQRRAEELEDLAYLYPDDPLDDDTRRLEDDLDRLNDDFFHLMTALDPPRDYISLAISELDDQRGLDVWLPALLEVAAQRGIELHGHLAGHTGPDPDPRKPRWDGRLGPPLQPDPLLLAVLESRPPRHIVLSLHGHAIGALFACEAGVHHLEGPSAPVPGTSATLLVRPLSLTRHLTQDDLTHPDVLPPPPDQLKALKTPRPFRRFSEHLDTATLDRHTRVPGPLSLTDFFARHERHAATVLRDLDISGMDRSILFDLPLDRTDEAS